MVQLWRDHILCTYVIYISHVTGDWPVAAAIASPSYFEHLLLFCKQTVILYLQALLEDS